MGDPSRFGYPDGEDSDSDDQLDETLGPIKGFDKKIYSNLNGQVQDYWESKASTAILIHYLDGGYGPGPAEDVKLIKDDLRSKPYTPNSKLVPRSPNV